MARKCAISGKPNLRTVRVTLEDGTTKKLKIAASELRTLKKDS